MSGPVNLLTIDLEEWFHICGVAGPLARAHWDQLPSRVDVTCRLLLDLLDRAQVPATWFAVGWVVERHGRLIEDIRAAGHDIGSHGYAHERAWELGPTGFREDVRRSAAVLRDIGVPLTPAFRAPEWSVGLCADWALPVLADEGFTHDTSLAPLKLVGRLEYPRYPHVRETPNGAIAELPPLVADRFGQVMPLGWGWGLRMSAPRRVLAAIDEANRRGHPAVLTVHPWELDPDPPRVPLSPRLWFAHYFRLAGFQDRLRQILHGTRFGRIADIDVSTSHP